MSFWNLSEGEDLTKTGQDSFEAAGGDLDVIPAKTQAMAMIEEAKWDKDRENNEYLSLRWTILKPDEYRNRKIFHKLWVSDADPRAGDATKAAKKRDNAKRMLAAIAQSAGGKLLEIKGKPSDEDLQRCLSQKPMMIRLMTWEMKNPETSEMMRGNWVQAVAPSDKMDVKAGEVVTGGAPVGLKTGTAQDDDIPFAPW